MSDDDISDPMDEDIDEEDYDVDDEFGSDGDDVDYEDYVGDMGLSSSQEIRRQKSYEVMSEDQLTERSQELIDEVKDMLGIPEKSATLLLLRHFKWNKEKLIESYTENSDKILKEAGATVELEDKPKSRTKKKYECLICTEEFSGKDTFALGCGHRYCLACWKSYLEVAIKEGAEGIWVKCPAPKCPAITHEEAWKKLVDKSTFKTYTKYLTRGLVTGNPLIKFCPAPGCSNAIRCERKGRREAVKCSCGYGFCFQCADYDIGDHMPATCENVRQWQERASSESENIKWLIANTKRCPTCGKPIEKNGGCMHMTCRKNSGGCGHEFCWLCRGPWSEHGSETGGYYACNKYNASNAKDEDIQSEQVKTELEAYMFYYHRFDSHRNAMKVADDQKRNADNKASEILSKYSVRSQDTKFLREAIEQILDNRRVLQWSYVYGFYLKDKAAEKKLFEFLQEDLEKHNERLSGLYETHLDKVEDYQAFMKWKEEVTNYTRVTAKFLEKFVEGVMRGLCSD